MLRHSDSGRHLLLVLVAMSYLIASVSFADEHEPIGPSERGWVTESGELAPDTSFRKSEGSFCAQLLVISDPSFLERWNQSSKVFEANSVESVVRGQTLLIIVAFANPTTDEQGIPDLTLDFRVFRPDGSSKGAVSGLPAWEGPPMPPEARRSLRLTTQYILFQTDEEDPDGRYQVQATIRDRIARKNLDLARSVTLTGPSE